MMVLSIHPGVSKEGMLSSMGFAPAMPAVIPTTEPPTREQVRLIRDVIDPKRMYMG